VTKAFGRPDMPTAARCEHTCVGDVRRFGSLAPYGWYIVLSNTFSCWHILMISVNLLVSSVGKQTLKHFRSGCGWRYLVTLYCIGCGNR
jgi:hypothetical protein